MAAEIYSAPEELKVPGFSWDMNIPAQERIKKHNEEEDQYRKDCKEFLKKNGFKGKNAGEIIRFPHADSYAEYMVMSMRPLRLMHMPLGDAWDSPYAHLMTAKEIQQRVDQNNARTGLFGSK